MSVADQPVLPEVDDIDLKVVPAALGGRADIHSEWPRPMHSQVLAVPPHFRAIAQFSQVQMDSGWRVIGRRFELKSRLVRRLPGIVFDTLLGPRGPIYKLGKFHGFRSTPFRIKVNCPRSLDFRDLGINREVAGARTILARIDAVFFSGPLSHILT